MSKQPSLALAHAPSRSGNQRHFAVESSCHESSLPSDYLYTAYRYALKAALDHSSKLVQFADKLKFPLGRQSGSSQGSPTDPYNNAPNLPISVPYLQLRRTVVIDQDPPRSGRLLPRAGSDTRGYVEQHEPGPRHVGYAEQATAPPTNQRSGELPSWDL